MCSPRASRTPRWGSRGPRDCRWCVPPSRQGSRLDDVAHACGRVAVSGVCERVVQRVHGHDGVADTVSRRRFPQRLRGQPRGHPRRHQRARQAIPHALHIGVKLCSCARPADVDAILLLCGCCCVATDAAATVCVMQIVMELKAKLAALETGPQQSPTAASPSSSSHGLGRFSLLRGPSDGTSGSRGGSGRASVSPDLVPSPMNVRLSGPMRNGASCGLPTCVGSVAVPPLLVQPS